MKVRIIKKYTVREGRFWNVDQRVDVTNDFGAELIKEGYAREIRIEKRADSKGNPYEVEVEDIDKSTKVSKLVKKQNEE
jgi:endonuclease YncB( thermonuclease family)